MGKREIYKTNPSRKTNKRSRDAYFTPDWLAKKCFNMVDKLIGEDIIEFIEPSAGDGVWLKYLNKPYKAYDIVPKSHLVEEIDFLKMEVSYKKGRCLIGNPPFGRAGNLMQAFIKKGFKIADYVAFILPASQYNNEYKFWEFDLIYSEHLGIVDFDGYGVNCCFNIYKRPNYAKIKPNYSIEGIVLEERRFVKNNKNKRSNDYSSNNYDFRICTWGSAAGEIIKDKDKNYAKEVAFWIEDKILRQKVYNLFETKSIKDYYLHTSTPNITKWQIVKFIKDHIEGVE